MNRFHSATRWPYELEERLDLARTDLDFCKTIARIHREAGQPLLFSQRQALDGIALSAVKWRDSGCSGK